MIEELRQAHIAKHGSFLFCPKREVLCFRMEEALCKTGVCEKKMCILDDPEYRKLQEKIRANFERNEEKRRQKKKEDPPKIRTQNKYPEEYIREKIKRLEDESREAYRRNRPNVGETKLHEAMMLRRELRRKDV